MFNNQTIFNLQGANLISGSYLVSGARTVQVSVTVSGVSGGAGLSIRFPGSTTYSVRLVDTRPDFNSPQSPSNTWAYMFFTDLGSGVNYQGNTGMVFGGGGSGALTNGTYQFMVETEGLVWLGCEVFSYSAGNATVTITTVQRTTA